MIRNYLRTAFRNLAKNKLFSFINIFGLALGFASCLLIGFYIQHEYSFDKYHQNSDRIYRLATEIKGSSYENGIARIGAPWGPAAKSEIPEVEESTRFMPYGPGLFRKENEQFYDEAGFYADASALKVFSWKLLQGNAETALLDPNSIVVSESFAKKYFGDKNPIGETLNLDNRTDLRVTGMVQDPPSNSHFNFSFLISLENFRDDELLDWRRNQCYTYLLLKPGNSPLAVSKKMSSILFANMKKEDAIAYSPFLQPLRSIHLESKLFREINTNGDITTIYIFEVIALIILVIACMNFINLTTAKAASRAKEVGIRKANGALRISLIRQFIMESLFISLIAGALACLLAYFFMDPFEKLMNRQIGFNVIEHAGLFILFFGSIIVTGILSSIYPALVLSSFKPVKVLKGNFSFKGNSGFRRALVVFQFTLSIALIFCVLIIGRQMRFMREKDLGFNKEQVLTIPLQNNETPADIALITDKLKAIPGIISLSASANQPGGNDWGIPYEAIGLSKDQWPPMRCLVADENFLNTYGIQLKEGRGFSKALATDSSAYLINETAARQLGWKDPIGQQLSVNAIGRKPGPIIGVVKDFHYHSLHDAIEPMYIFMNPQWFSQLNVRIDESRTEPVLADLKKAWSLIEPKFPFTYNFLDDRFQAFYENEKTISQLLVWFTVMAIVISCLGLYALSILIARKRVREIGIRKVLGASVAGLVTMMSKDLFRLVIIAMIIASPIAWYFMNKWLEDFAYRIPISWWMFVVTGLIAIFIALITISFQAIRAAVANPVKSLRTE